MSKIYDAIKESELNLETTGIGLEATGASPYVDVGVDVLPPKITVRRSKRVGELITALVAAQLEYDVVAKDAENPAYARGNRVSKYATLDSAVTATRPHLNKHGLTIMQHLQSDNATKELIVTTSLYHISGQYFESDLALPSIGQGNRFDPQTLASASTYGRRITWLAISGAAPGDDDDANKASGIGTHEEAQAVGEKKIASLKAKKAPTNGTSDTVPSLFYVWHDQSQSAEVMGDEGYKSANRDVLKPLWDPGVKAIVANADQLEYLKMIFEERKVPFSALKAK